MESVNTSRILVVEDDPFWQKVIQRNLEKASESCSITFARNTSEAMRLISDRREFQLIIADQYLDEEKTGYEFWFECQRRGIRAPFILTSGYTKLTDEVARGLPMKFVEKPFVATEFRRTIRELLGAGGEEARSTLAMLVSALNRLSIALYYARLW